MPDAPAESVGRMAALGRAFRYRNYRLFFAGQLVSLIGTWTQSVGQTWLVYRLTGSALLLGTVTFCQQAPVFLFATVGGSVADRLPRRSVLIATQSAAMTLALVLATLTLSGVVNGARIIGPAIAGFAVQAFGEGWCFLVNGVSFTAVIAGLLAMRDLPPSLG